MSLRFEYGRTVRHFFATLCIINNQFVVMNWNASCNSMQSWTTHNWERSPRYRKTPLSFSFQWTSSRKDVKKKITWNIKYPLSYIQYRGASRSNVVSKLPFEQDVAEFPVLGNIPTFCKCMAKQRRKYTKHRVPGVAAPDIFEFTPGLRQRPRLCMAGLALILGLP